MLVITGGSGFIGSNLAWDLYDRYGGSVVICDRLRDQQKWKNLNGLPVTDFVSPPDLMDFLENNKDTVQAIIHMGAVSSTTFKDVDFLIQNNLQFSIDLFDYCARYSLPFIYASSAATYGNGENGYNDGDELSHLRTLMPLNPYGWSKHLFDQYIAKRKLAGGTLPPQYAGLKFFNVFGPNELHKGGMMSVLTKNYQAFMAGEEIKLFRSHRAGINDGEQLRDFVYVKDCSKVVAWLLDNPMVSGLFNVGSGKARSFRDLITAGYAAAGTPANITYIDMPVEIRDRYQYFTEADLSSLRAAGYREAFYDLEGAVADYFQQCLVHHHPYRSPVS